MSDPLSFLPLTLAGANGRIDGIDCRRLVASGVSLLQRTAPLVRALDGRRSAILLPVGRHLLVALAASSGRAAVLLDPALDPARIATVLRTAQVGAVFTLRAFGDSLPAGVPRLYLDDSPSHAEWSSGASIRRIDLSLHSGLMLEGDPETDGAHEEAAVLLDEEATGGLALRHLSHRQILAGARTMVRSHRMDAREHALTLVSASGDAGLMFGLVAPLLSGGQVSTGRAGDALETIARIERQTITTLVAPRAAYAAMADALMSRSRTLDAPILHRCIADDGPVDDSLAARWRSASAIPLVSLERRDAADPALGVVPTTADGD
jgi:acyl-CoA synthetase (AMP-forming)/AMP-acid ligase II